MTLSGNLQKNPPLEASFAMGPLSLGYLEGCEPQLAIPSPEAWADCSVPVDRKMPLTPPPFSFVIYRGIQAVL